ncbi:aldo/keto reductase [Nocardia sp. 348MFTsu5.1]|uniref:aldo/keto reductase n=1 Tax=Nocardia sp. 348MFTsu5.1 TaxID=1172185 RepID=UPI0003A918A0|nr:aldo/keto reductase [Nocardia sp. 348MFTsu5.1]
MKSYDLPQTSLHASSIILGLMRILKLEDEEIRRLVESAFDVGVTMFDHADVYGGGHNCERRFGDAMASSSIKREDVIIQTKVGLVGGIYYDLSTDHILQAVDESLTALRTDYLDSLVLHRPDALVEPEEVAAAFDVLESAGKVRNFGVSNCNPGQIALLKTAVKQPIVFNQVQLSITHAPIIAAGLTVNMANLEQSNDATMACWTTHALRVSPCRRGRHS